MGLPLPLALTPPIAGTAALVLGPLLALEGSLLALATITVAWLFFRGRKEERETLSISENAPVDTPTPASADPDPRSSEQAGPGRRFSSPTISGQQPEATSSLDAASDVENFQDSLAALGHKNDPVALAVLAACIPDATQPCAVEPAGGFDPDATLRSNSATFLAAGGVAAMQPAVAPAGGFDPDATVRSSVTKFQPNEEAVGAPQLAGAPGRADAAPPHPASTVGTGPLLARASRLLPAPTAGLTAAEPSPRKGHGRGANGSSVFQPAARFARSQQAFLHVPVVLSGAKKDGSAFHEENRTLILLPQGAVVSTSLPLAAKDELTLLNPATRQEVPCIVFGALAGPDGKYMVELEFRVPVKNFWPVSFPAWSGNGAARPGVKNPAREGTAARTPALSDSRS